MQEPEVAGMKRVRVRRSPARQARLKVQPPDLPKRRPKAPCGEDVPTDTMRAAHAAGLVYVCDDRPGIRRLRRGRGFRYLGPEGQPIRDADDLARIRKLAIPPAWRDVWICPDPRGHMQATARDARGRKQYRYHPRWREVRDEAKYGRMVEFGRILPKIRRRTERDLARPGLPREKVLAAVVRLLEATLIRVGNEEYARQNRSFGLTTLRDRHASVEGYKIRFRFRGKSGKEHEVGVQDRRLSNLVKRCQELPGQDLFQYVDDSGRVRNVGSSDVNDYLREIGGEDFTAKDFRTWAGTVLAAWALQEFQAVDSHHRAKKNVVRAIEQVAERLGNTPSVCRQCYVHPTIIDAYLEGSLVQQLKARVQDELLEGAAELRPEEAAVLGLLLKRLSREAKVA
jgi:DNA topoisomerase I